MAAANTPETLQRPGDVDIIEATLIAGGTSRDVISGTNVDRLDIKQYIGEFNLFEDMFGPGLSGNLLLIDPININELMNLRGDEWIVLKLKTPSIDDQNGLIYKTFKVYSISDRQMISDTGKQSYVLHFCSPESLVDTVSPLYKTYQGKVHEVVTKIFEDNVKHPRNENQPATGLIILGPTDNEVKFTSPGWRPVQCLNWLASKAIGQGYKNPGYLFYESNKSFYFANIEAIIDSAIKSKSVYQKYKFVGKKVNADPSNTDQGFVQNADEEYGKVEDMKVISNFNYFKDLQNGYLANRLFTLDVITKKYNAGHDYDHVTKYQDYKHLENIGGTGNDQCQPFRTDVAHDPAGQLMFYPQHSTLYTDFKNNVSDRIEEIMQPRLSNLNEITNFKIEITVPGRTDIEVGSVIHFYYPSAKPRSAEDKLETMADVKFTGYYLVTAIRHKFTLTSHVMVLEIVKDSLGIKKQ